MTHIQNLSQDIRKGWELFNNSIWIVIERVSILMMLFITDIFVARHLAPVSTEN